MITVAAPAPLTSPDSQSEVRVMELPHGQEAAWDRFVTRTDAGTFFHLTGWKNVIEGVLNRQCFYLAAYRDNEITGVLPISRVRNLLFGDCLVSLPLAVYGGVCASDEESHRALLNAGKELATRLGVKYLELRHQSEVFHTDLPDRDLYVTFTQDLTPGPEKLLKGLPRDTRYAIRKGQKAGLQWTQDLLLSEFYELYARSVHRLGTPVFPLSLFQSLLREFPNQVRLFAVRKGERAIAGVLCFYFRDQVLPYYAGALPEFYRDSPNNFMYWSLIEQSCKEGLKTFDFGRSKRGTGSFEFKNTWSMAVTPLPYRYLLVTAKEVPQMSAIDKKFQLPVETWKRLPLGLTKFLGPRVIRWVPSI